MMRIVSMPVLCLDCGHRWAAETVTDAPAGVIIASWKALHCPQPGCRADSNRLAFATEPDAESAA